MKFMDFMHAQLNSSTNSLHPQSNLPLKRVKKFS